MKQVMNITGKSNFKRLTSWVFRLLAAAILLQTLYFKFTAAPESVYIFETVGMEPWGRYGSAFIELAAGILLLLPSSAWIGVFMALAVMAGAIISHLTVLGIEVMDDGGTLFILAITVFVSCLVTLYLDRGRVKKARDSLFGKDI